MYTGNTVDTVVYEASDVEEFKRTTSEIKIPKRGMWINVVVQADHKCLMITATVPHVVAPEAMDQVYGILESEINTTLNIRDIVAEDAVVSTFTRVYTLDGKVKDPEAYKPMYRTDFRKSSSKVRGAVDKGAIHMLMGILGVTAAYKK